MSNQTFLFIWELADIPGSRILQEHTSTTGIDVLSGNTSYICTIVGPTGSGRNLSRSVGLVLLFMFM